MKGERNPLGQLTCAQIRWKHGKVQEIARRQGRDRGGAPRGAAIGATRRGVWETRTDIGGFHQERSVGEGGKGLEGRGWAARKHNVRWTGTSIFDEKEMRK